MSESKDVHASPTNYCRQFVSYAQDLLFRGKVKEKYRGELSRLAGLATAAQKFLLPDGGVYLDDPEFTALDADLELALPFPVLALEYAVRGSDGRILTKNILLCEQEDDRIIFHPIMMVVGVEFASVDGLPVDSVNRVWRPYQAGSIKTSGYRRPDGWSFRKLDHPFADLKLFPSAISGNENDFVRENCELLLLFLNTLACSNVAIEASIPSKQPKASKGALPFDIYHVLSVRSSSEGGQDHGGTHRSPREHLRRGHIRRLSTGKKIWINAVVVNAGAGASVLKDYRLGTGSNQEQK
jgi:hypothetical protein